MDSFLIIFISALLLGATAGYLGSILLSRKMAVIVDPLSHLALPGVALALVFQKDVSLGAFLFLFLGTILIWFLEQKTNLSTETIVAILFSVGLAITFIFLDEEQLHTALLGDISKIGLNHFWIFTLICFLILILIRIIYKKIILISISEDLARAEGIDIKKYQFLYLLSLSAIVSVGVKFVGGLLVAGLTALPSATARMISRNLHDYQIFSLFFGLMSVCLGVLFFKITNLPLGSLIIISSFFIFLIFTFFKKR